MAEFYQTFGPFGASEVRLRTVSPITVVMKASAPDVRAPLADQINQPNEEIAFLGHIVIRRGNPVRRADGKHEIPQQIADADSWGYSQILKSRVRITQNNKIPSLGKTIQKEAGVDFPAESYFNVNFEFTAPDLPDFPTLTNSSQINVASAEILRIPPLMHAYEHMYEANPIPLIDSAGATHAWFTAGLKIAYKVETMTLLDTDPFAP